MRKSRPGHHKISRLDPGHYPAWMLQEGVDEHSCLYGVGEDVISAKFHADEWHASEYISSSEPYAAALKSFARMGDESLSVKKRTLAGTRAMRKFWDAKVAARRVVMRGRK